MKRARDPNLIREAMKARADLTFRELGLLAGCSDGTIRFILNGRPTNPRLARRIAHVLRRPLDELFLDAESSAGRSSGDCEAVA